VPSALAATLIALSLTPSVVEARTAPTATVQLAQYQCRLMGPYATIRRAYEVANAAMSYGYSASQPYHSGDGWYFRVC
jgi:hypothetical protein